MLETVSEVMDVERCEEVLEEESSLVEEVVPECSKVLRKECSEVLRKECIEVLRKVSRLNEQECSSMERQQCWLGSVRREVSFIKWLHSTVREKQCLC